MLFRLIPVLPALFLSLLSLAANPPASPDPIITPGNITHVSIEGNTLRLTMENASARITIYNNSVVRVRLSRTPFTDDFSYAVVSKPETTPARITQTDQEIRITTDSLHMVIGRHPFAIHFSTPEGQIINEDEEGLTTSWAGTAVTSYKKLQEGERFIGLGEKTGPLDRAGSGYTNWNSDVFGYQTGQDPLYSTIPFYIGIHHELNYGIFLDNTYRTDFNFGASNNRFSFFSAVNGEMNYYFIYHHRVADIIRDYTWLTGRMPLPPLWSLGYQQNRYSYYPDTEVERIAATLREKKIPCDGITLDIHYMDEYKLFTWNKSRFPDPKVLIDRLKSQGFKLTVIVDPGIKVEKGYPAYESGLKQDIFLKYSDGKNYTGQVWPGWCHFPDFTSAKGRDWWKAQIRNYTNIGVAGIWNDMNEIATWGQKMPDNVLFDFDGHPTTHQQGHNVFAQQMDHASYEGAREGLQQRPFILTRAGYAGLQRYSAIWTGDNRSEDDHMLAGVRLLNSLGLSGVSFTGMDIGGFTGNPSIGLYTRWMQLGAFIPYYRNHTAVNTRSSEPWTYGEEAMEITRNYVNLRYRLMPYIYSAFYESTRSGLPVMRSLAIDYTYDAAIYDPNYQNQYQFGPSLLVVPVESSQAFTRRYLPKGTWYNLYTDEAEAGGASKIIALSNQELPVYVKESSIIPMQSLVQSTAEAPTDTLTLHVYKGSIPNSYVYYEDDGASYAYEKGSYYRRTIQYDPAAGTLTLNKPEGSYGSHFHHIALVLHGFDELTSVKDNSTGASLMVQDNRFSFLSAISRFDVQGGVTQTDSCPIKMVVFDNKNDTQAFKF